MVSASSGIDGADAGERFSVVHHTIAPRQLAAPLHLHHREDEYPYFLKGRMGALLGDDVAEADAGSWVYKPRAQWHTFWNAGDEPCHIIELIAPAGFEHYFRELAEVWPDLDRFAAIDDRFGLEMDFDSVRGSRSVSASSPATRGRRACRASREDPGRSQDLAVAVGRRRGAARLA